MPQNSSFADEVPHGTTIVASTFDGGIVMVGDRRATMGNLISSRAVEKVTSADEYTAIGFAGTAAFGAELVRLYQVELEHYEKLEGAYLSVDGKANRLSMLIRSNLAMAMQGLAVVPLLAAFDIQTGKGRIFSYDVAGGRQEENNFAGVGSGSLFARGALKKLYREDADQTDCVIACLQAIYDAADDDSATGGPDVFRKIYPRVAVITDSGYQQLSDDDVSAKVDLMLSGRARRPDGPTAPVLDNEGSDA